MPSSRRELQGPRPPPLMVSKTSGKVKKPDRREPVVVHLHTPKVIHASPQDFMSLVQRLTGKSSSASSLSSRGRAGQEEVGGRIADARVAGDVGGGGGDGDPLLLTLGQFSSASSVPSPIISPSLFFCSPSAQPSSLQDFSPLF
ncbi:hypothetical protein Cni_G17680 [Canna indica]|uniref:VQ domain-containing protein n=1 Tax=Canna indica TaxID=4628 RepID=A0AAQ3KMT2_9LILI|nr:hypothetical protein Cni_G17680 [Canna indica]